VCSTCHAHCARHIGRASGRDCDRQTQWTWRRFVRVVVQAVTARSESRSAERCWDVRLARPGRGYLEQLSTAQHGVGPDCCALAPVGITYGPPLHPPMHSRHNSSLSEVQFYARRRRAQAQDPAWRPPCVRALQARASGACKVVFSAATRIPLWRANNVTHNRAFYESAAHARIG